MAVKRMSQGNITKKAMSTRSLIAPASPNTDPRAGRSSSRVVSCCAEVIPKRLARVQQWPLSRWHFNRLLYLADHYLKNLLFAAGQEITFQVHK